MLEGVAQRGVRRLQPRVQRDHVPLQAVLVRRLLLLERRQLVALRLQPREARRLLVWKRRIVNFGQPEAGS